MFSPLVKENLIDLSTTAQALVKNFTPYTNDLNMPEILRERWESSTKAAAAISSAIGQLQSVIEEINASSAELSVQYTDSQRGTKAKKEMYDELTDILQAANVQKVRKEVRELTFALKTRRDEASCIAQQCSSLLGFSTDSQNLVPNEYLDDQDEDEVLDKTMVDFFQTPKKTAQLPQLAPKRRVRIPKMSVPKFAGESENFAEFWAVFSSMVDENTELENMEKILLLKDSLEGKALKVIAGIQVVPKNYEWMKQTLQTKYTHSSSNRATIVQKLVNLPPAGNSASECSDTLDEIRALVNQMISTGHDIGQSCDAMWKETIYKKFPYRVLEKILTDNYDKINITIRSLLDQLEKEISSRMHIETHLRPYQETAQRPPAAIENRGPAQRCSKQTTPSTHDTRSSCLFCDRSHPSAQCRTVIDAWARRHIVVEKRACYKCFETDHRSKDCPLNNCVLCNGMHDKSLCLKPEQMPPLSNMRSANSDQPQPTQNTNCFTKFTPFPPVPQETTQFEQNDYHFANHAQLNMDERTPFQTVLMSAEGFVYNFSTNRYERMTFFFDIGAQQTVIEEATAKRLGLAIKGSKALTMSGMGNHLETFTSHQVEVNFTSCHGEHCKFLVQTKPVLTGGFKAVRLTRSDSGFMREHDISLATSKIRGETTLPHIIVGADFFNDMVFETRAIQLPSGLFVARTLLGRAADGRGYLDFPMNTEQTNYSVNMSGIVDIPVCEEKEIVNHENLGDTKTKTPNPSVTNIAAIEMRAVSTPLPVVENVAQIKGKISPTESRAFEQVSEAQEPRNAPAVFYELAPAREQPDIKAHTAGLKRLKLDNVLALAETSKTSKHALKGCKVLIMALLITGISLISLNTSLGTIDKERVSTLPLTKCTTDSDNYEHLLYKLSPFSGNFASECVRPIIEMFASSACGLAPKSRDIHKNMHPIRAALHSCHDSSRLRRQQEDVPSLVFQCQHTAALSNTNAAHKLSICYHQPLPALTLTHRRLPSAVLPACRSSPYPLRMPPVSCRSPSAAAAAFLFAFIIPHDTFVLLSS